MSNVVDDWIRRRVLRWCCAIFCAAAFVLSAPAATRTGADYLINVWRSEDGLPQNSVNCLAQTPDGYLWIGTRSGGLARFDGARFVIFNPQSTPELKDVEFETLSVDSLGVLWITAGNESVANVSQGKFRLIREPNSQPRWHPLQIITDDSNQVFQASFHPSIFRVARKGALNDAKRIDLNPPPLQPLPPVFVQSPDGGLWYLTEDNRVARMDLSSGLEKPAVAYRLPSPARLLAKDSSGRLWVAADEDFGVMSTNGFSPSAIRNGPAPRGIRQMVPTADGGLWVWDGSLLRKMRDGNWVVSTTQFKSSGTNQPLRFFADSESGLWVIEYGTGLWHVHPDGSTALLTRQDGLPSRFVTCWLEDNEGNIWVGTKEAGLARIRRRQFKEFTAADGIPGDVAQTICEDAQGVIWVGTATGGLARKAGDEFVQVPLTSAPDPFIESVTVCPDETNGIWIGTLQGSVFRCISNTVHCVNNEVDWTFPLERLRDHVANAMMQDSFGRVWFANGSGAYFFQNDKLTMFGSERGFVEGIGVRALAEGPPGTLWFGTEPGDLWRIVKDVPTRFHPPAEWQNARVSALLPDTDGGVWIGTLGGGLLHFENGKFTRVTKQQGLPDNSITQLLDDGMGNLWAGTYAGLFHAAKKNLKDLAAGAVSDIPLSLHGRFVGLPAQAYSGWFQPSCWRARDGRLWFTTVKGLVAVNPREVTVSHRPPPVVVEEMHVDGESFDFSSAVDGEKRELRIGPGRHYIEFRFTGINFTAPDAVRFKWRLEGAEKNWRESVSQRGVGYGPLVPGDYRFRVLAANSDGIWNETGASIAFVVLPFFWETWWFKFLLAGVTCVGLALLVTLQMRRRHRLELERLERGNEMERERTRIAQDMHDEIGSKLARISFLSELAKGEAKGDRTVDSLAKTARDLLQSLERMVWAVSPRNDSLDELSSYLNRYASEYFQNTPIRCRLSFPKNLPNIQLSAETRHNIFLAFEEALANTLKHSQATEVGAELHYENEAIEISVVDNGRGFDLKTAAAKSDAHGEHLGLSGMHQRLRSIQGECQVVSSPGGGTTVKFKIPLTNAQ